MRISRNRYKFVACLFIAQVCLFFPQRSLCQTETFDIIHFTPPKDWKKNVIEGAITYSNANTSTGGFCVLTIYSSTASLDTPQEDFSNEWTRLVVKPYKAEANPKTETQTTADGWKVTAGGANVEMDGIKFLVVLTLFTGFDKRVSVVANLNDQSYLAVIDALLQNMKFEKTASASALAPRGQNNPAASEASNSTAAAIEWFALLRAYQANEIAADGKYTGKRIRVIGPFEHAAMEQGRIVVWFNTPAESFSHLGCYVLNSQRSAVAALKPGQEIIVEGICRGRVSVGRLMIEDCVLK
jgi:tRNA_anti-like